MQTAIRFDQKRLPAETEELRADVRAFLAEEIARGTFAPGKGLQQDAFEGKARRQIVLVHRLRPRRDQPVTATTIMGAV